MIKHLIFFVFSLHFHSLQIRRSISIPQRLLVVLFLVFPSWLHAQDEAATHADIRKSLAFVEVFGQKANGVPLQSSGTGVLLDEIGHVLTVLHLVDQVESQALDSAFEVSVRIGDRNGPRRPATVIRRDSDRDVLVLRIETAAEPYEPACFGDTRPPLPSLGDLFLTSGFPLNLGYFTGSGKVTTTDGPRGLFGINIPISSGQSGSPVYDPEGRVLGLMVGSLEGEGIAGQHYYRPLRHIWDVALSFAEEGDCDMGVEPPRKSTVDALFVGFRDTDLQIAIFNDSSETHFFSHAVFSIHGENRTDNYRLQHCCVVDANVLSNNSQSTIFLRSRNFRSNIEFYKGVLLPFEDTQVSGLVQIEVINQDGERYLVMMEVPQNTINSWKDEKVARLRSQCLSWPEPKPSLCDGI